MSDVAIRHLRERLRVPAPDQALVRGLQGARDEALESGLEHALERAGLAAGEELCIRDVRATLRLAPSLPRPVLAAEWARAVAAALAEAVRRGGPDVVRYRSRAQALVDVLAGTAAEDFGRAWAWRRMDLWRAPANVSPAGTALECAAMLAREAQLAPAALAALARAPASAGGGADALVRLLERMPARALEDVALAAARAAGCDAALERPMKADAGDSPDVATRAVALPSRSAIARAAERRLEPGVARSVAVLALLEAEPAALRRAGGAGAEVAAVTRALTRAPRGERPWTPRAPAPDRRKALSYEDAAPDLDANVTSGPAAMEPELASPVRPLGDESFVAPADSPPARPPAHPPRPERALPQVRASGRTSFGGLLFCLNVLAEPELLEALLEPEPALAARPLRWTLHALALALIPAQPADPAALAFAGLAPDREPPSAGAHAPSPGELDALTALAEHVGARLRERLGRREAAAVVLQEVTRREAEIVADPGWIEVHFRLADVDTRLRRCGLDLDPGWLPWLGAVVRFAYA